MLTGWGERRRAGPTWSTSTTTRWPRPSRRPAPGACSCAASAGRTATPRRTPAARSCGSCHPPDGIRLDASTGLVTAHAGVSFDDLLRHLVPQGYFVPVTPGTRFVTLGGAIASDVHGKNHHVDGSFGNHLRSMSMLMADGTMLELTPESDPELWWATIGGMGLTGIVVEATFAALPIETSRCVVDTTRTGDLDSLLAAMAEGDEQYRYSVAWVDLLAKGKHLGRSVLTRGDHATVVQVTGHRDPTGYGPRMLAAVPPGVPNLINHASVRAFNEMWFRKAPRRRQGEIQSITRFFHPLDGIAAWNRVYGRRGFLQYQFVVPFGEEAALRGVIERVVRSGHASFVAVLKRFGPGNPGPLSFPMAGMDADGRPAGRRGRAERTPPRSRRSRARRRRAPLPGEGLAHDAGRRSAAATRGCPSGRRRGTRPIRAGCGSATSPGGSS